MARLAQGRNRIDDRFPVTLILLLFWGFAFLTLPFLGLSVDVTPLLSAKAEIGLTMFIGGIVLLFATSLVFTGGFELIKPARPFLTYTSSQALIVVSGFLLVSIWQIYVNQASIRTALASAVITVPSQTALVFSVDISIAEEALFGAVTVLIFLSLVYLRLGRLAAAAVTLPAVAGIFTAFHLYVYGTNPAALWFVFGARLVLGGVLLATLHYSRHKGVHPSASLVAPQIIHTIWNVLTLPGVG